MPIFYNTTQPTPETSNSINNVSIDIRDFLLNQNISSTYPSVSTAVNGSPQVGQPVLDTESNHLNFYPHQQLDLNTTNIDILGSVLNGQGVGIGAGGSPVPNFDVRSSLAGRVLGATGLLNDTKIGTIGAQQLALALANNAAFNVEQSLLGSLNVQDNVLALVKGAPLPGFRPSYQITIPSGGLGRAVDFAGKMLGFTIPRSYLGDEGSIFQPENGATENIKRANSMIENTGKGQVLALLANARANLDVNSYETPFRTGYAPGFANNKGDIQITDAKLYAFSNDGKNFENVLAISDGFIPDLSISREEKVSKSGFESPEQKEFIGHRSNPGYNDRKINDVAFSWGSTVDSTVNVNSDYSPMAGDKKSLLVKTQKLFDSVGMKNIVTVKGDMNKESTQLSQANGGGFSKGNAVMSSNMFGWKDPNEPKKKILSGYYNGSKKSADETYCRSWTTINRYDKIGKLVRSGTDSIEDEDEGEESTGIYGSSKVPYRDTKGNTKGSILGKYGFPKITPYTTDKSTDLKQYMFSIENLAWADSTHNLPDYEIGSGDLVNNKKGRIMWFPPYDINFSESNNINWESTNFIGRGEPVYTYNNTERAGNLSFKIVVDHPSYINSFRGVDGPDDHYVNSFWAGCIPPEFKDKLITVSEKSWEEELSHTIPLKSTPTPEPAPPIKLSIFFPNDRSALPPDNYENGLSGSSPTSYIDYVKNPNGYGYGTNKMLSAQATPGQHLENKQGWIDNTNYGLNGFSIGYGYPVFFADKVFWGWRDRVELMAEADKWLKEKCPNCIVKVKGFASQQGISKSNANLIKNRANNVIAELKKYLFKDLTGADKNDRFKYEQGYVPTTAGCRVGVEEDIEFLPCKTDRRAEVTFEWSAELAGKNFVPPEITIDDGTRTYNQKITDRFYNETLYFDQLTDIDPLVFDSFREKIKYFHPAFHSTTPEGLNSRLNFLLQCTRQGPTYEAQGPNNLAFGRPPVCILRIGDFYNTKIVMDSVNIDYEPLVWDLNPEGIGVQPMIANVTISFKFLGGSSLMGPINKLQNALSFNYFANTQVYDARADYISKDKIAKFTVNGEEGVGFGYHINDGELNLNKLKEELNPPTYTDNPFSPPPIDEVATQDKGLLGVEEAPLTNTLEDKSKTWNAIANFTGNHILKGDPAEAVSGEWKLDITIPDGLSKEYNFSVRVCDATSTTNEIYVGKLTTGTTVQTFSYPMNFTADKFKFVKIEPNYDGKIETPPKYQMMVEIKELNMKAYSITF
jgi:hypothetical protein